MLLLQKEGVIKDLGSEALPRKENKMAEYLTPVSEGGSADEETLDERYTGKEEPNDDGSFDDEFDEQDEGKAGLSDDIYDASDEELYQMALEAKVDLKDLDTREEVEEAILKSRSNDEDDFDEENWMDALPEEARQVVQKRLQGASELRVKAQLVDQIASDPKTMLERLANHYGVDLGAGSRVGSQHSIEDRIKDGLKDMKPEEGEDPVSFVSKLVAKALAVGQAQKPSSKQPSPQDGLDPRLRRAIGNAISQISRKYSDWALYDQKMLDLVRRDITLLDDPDELYAMASGRRTRRARSQNRRNSRQSSSSSTRSSRRSSRGRRAKGPLSFEESWDKAMRQERFARSKRR